MCPSVGFSQTHTNYETKYVLLLLFTKYIQQPIAVWLVLLKYLVNSICAFLDFYVYLFNHAYFICENQY